LRLRAFSPRGGEGDVQAATEAELALGVGQIDDGLQVASDFAKGVDQVGEEFEFPVVRTVC
jgi:hypothetical protein